MNIQTKIETTYRTCNLCEAICGLEIKIADGKVLSIRGDKDDPLSKGHICPKATAIKDGHEDPDRLRKPVKRIGSEWVEIEWDEALDLVAERLVDVQKKYGDDAVSDYLGNPLGNIYGILTHSGYLRNTLKSKNFSSVNSLDHIANLVVSSLMYGNQFILPVPDIDRTDLFMVIGANPLASNGSMMTAPGMRGRLKALKARGGKLIVIDPRRTETAEVADEHHFLRPGADAALLLAMLNAIFDEGLDNPGRLAGFANGLAEVAEAVKPFTPERAAAATGMEPGAIRHLARALAGAEKGVFYGRIGTCTQEYGTLAQWLLHVINIVTGSLDHEGGFMLTTPAVDSASDPAANRGNYDAWRTRVRKLPSFNDEIPLSTIAEEILTEGPGQIKAFICVAGNPVLSFPGGGGLDEALPKLDFMVSVDPYINESSRHAHVILPPASALERDQYELFFHLTSVRDIGRYIQPTFPKPDDAMYEWEIFIALGERVAKLKGLPVEPTMRPEEMIKLGIEAGPYSKAAGHPLELTFERLLNEPHGIDLGPLKPRLPEFLFTEDKRINCAPPQIMADLERAKRELFDKPLSDDLLLIGRRQVRSKNSWMHNYRRLVKGEDRCVMFMHPDDLAKRQLHDGQSVKVASRTGDVVLSVVATDEMMPGVVSIPHGWGHGRKGVQLTVASEFPGVSANDITDAQMVDPISGSAVYSGIPVTVERADETVQPVRAAGS